MTSFANYAGSPAAYRTVTPAKSEPLPTVFIIDTDESVRKSIAALVQFQGCGVRTFQSALDFLSLKRDRAPACLVVDVYLPGLSGLELQERLKREDPKMPIIFLAGHSDVSTSVRAMKAGAMEFLTKPIDGGALVAAVKEALIHSHAWFVNAVELEALRADFQALSKREREVMALIVSGLMNKQVAGELRISEITVKAHRGRVMRKMKARSFAGLIQMATRLNDGRSRPAGRLEALWP